MGQHLAKVLYVCALGGCSLIYNPSNLPEKGSMPPDAPIADANPALLHIDEVKSPPLLEGAGQSGSAPQVLVVYGGHITQGAMVTLAPATADANVVVELKNISIALDGNSFAGTVTAAYMDMLDETGANMSAEIPLTITVSQDGAPAPVTLPWALKPLDELTTAGAQAVPPAGKLFSRVDVTGDLIYPAGLRPVIRAIGSIKITGKVTANSPGSKVAGAGGCAGGAADSNAECFGGGKAGGGGGGFANTGGDGDPNTGGPVSGDPLVRSFDGSGMEMNRGGGGGGGASAIGGGGGGTIEITAGGNLQVGSLEANGVSGAGSLLGRGAGGGAGGAVVLRAGAMLTLPTGVALNPGAGGAGTLGLANKGGDGSVGRWRYDANATTGTPPGAPPPKRGPILVRPENPIFEKKEVPQFMVNGDPGGSGAGVDLVVQFADGTTDTKTVNLTGATSTVVTPNLQIGLNIVCVVIAGGNFADEEAKNCIEVAFVP